MKLVYVGGTPRVLIGVGELQPGQEFDGDESHLTSPWITAVGSDGPAAAPEPAGDEPEPDQPRNGRGRTGRGRQRSLPATVDE